MFITESEKIIIKILLIIIILYSIFAYSYIYNNIDIIHFNIKKAEKKLLINFDENDINNINIAKEFLNNYISKYINYIKSKINDILIIKMNIETFLNNVNHDFFIYI